VDVKKMAKGGSMSDRGTLMQELDSRFAEFKETFVGLSDFEMNTVWCGEWSARDIIIHVVGWHWEMSKSLQRMGRGERPTPEGVNYDGDTDRWNEWFISERRGRRLDQVIAEMEEAFEAYRVAAMALPEERFTPGRTVDRILRTTGVDHFIEHGEQIKAWRQRL
jgi:hypothetical protein